MAKEPADLPRLNAAAAKGLDTITRAVVSAGFEAVKLTFLSRSWEHLGYASFEAWAAGMPKYQLTRDERKALVTELDGLGMTQRQIASTVGAGVATVNRDLDVPDGTTGEWAPDPKEEISVPDGTSDEPDRAQGDAPVARWSDSCANRGSLQRLEQPDTAGCAASSARRHPSSSRTTSGFDNSTVAPGSIGTCALVMWTVAPSARPKL